MKANLLLISVIFGSLLILQQTSALPSSYIKLDELLDVLKNDIELKNEKMALKILEAKNEQIEETDSQLQRNENETDMGKNFIKRGRRKLYSLE